MKAFAFRQYLWILIYLAIYGCHANNQIQSPQSGPEPQNMMREFAQIWLDNGTNCSKTGMELRQFIDDNAETWRNYLIAETIERLKDGQNAEQALRNLLALPNSTEEELNHSICQDNSVVHKALEKFDDEIFDKVLNAAKAYSEE